MMNKNWVCFVGSFDPITNGHLDIIERASAQYEKVFVGVGHNSKKKYAFSQEDRMSLIGASVSHLENIVVDHYDGLAIDFVDRCGAGALLRSARSESDMGFELQLAQMNKKLNADIETVLFFASQEYSHISSTFVRELLQARAEISNFVPTSIEIELREKFDRGKG